LAELARRDERHPPVEREPGPEHEAAGLDRHHRPGALDALRERLERERQRLRTLEQGRDVLEHDPALGEVGNVADVAPQLGEPRRGAHWTTTPADRSSSSSSIASRSFCRARDSIWRTRSRDKPKWWPVWARVRATPSWNP